jgi:hypothetical protein
MDAFHSAAGSVEDPIYISDSENDDLDMKLEPDYEDVKPVDLFKISDPFPDQVDGILSRIKTVIGRRPDKRPVLLYIDGEPGAGTSTLAYKLACRMNAVTEDGYHKGPPGYVDLYRLVVNHKASQEATIISKLPSASTHPYYSDPCHYVGWSILSLLEFYKRREKELNAQASVTVCDTSPFYLLESLVPDAKKKGYLVRDQSRMIHIQIWALLTWITSQYRVFRVFVNRPFPEKIIERVRRERRGGYTDEVIEPPEFNRWPRQFTGLLRLEHPAMIHFLNDGEYGDIEEIVNIINLSTEYSI